MELFMIKTGFYQKCVARRVFAPCLSLTGQRVLCLRLCARVTVIEAERLIDVQTGAAPQFGKRAPDPWAHRT